MVRPLLAALRKELAAFPGTGALCAKIDSTLAEKGKIIPLKHAFRIVCGT